MTNYINKAQEFGSLAFRLADLSGLEFEASLYKDGVMESFAGPTREISIPGLPMPFFYKLVGLKEYADTLAGVAHCGELLFLVFGIEVDLVTLFVVDGSRIPTWKYMATRPKARSQSDLKLPVSFDLLYKKIQPGVVKVFQLIGRKNDWVEVNLEEIECC
jgi:hypothetical protein